MRYVRVHTEQKQNVEDLLYDLIFDRLRTATTAMRGYTGISDAKLKIDGDVHGLYGTVDLKDEGVVDFEIKVKVKGR